MLHVVGQVASKKPSKDKLFSRFDLPTIYFLSCKPSEILVLNRKIGPIYVNICQRIFRVDDPSCPKLQFSHKCRDCLASCKKHILVDAAAAAEREESSAYEKTSVIFLQ